MKATKIQCECATIICQTSEDGVTEIESDLTANVEEDDTELLAALNAVECLILAHYSAGVKVGSPAYGLGLDTALESIINHLT